MTWVRKRQRMIASSSGVVAIFAKFVVLSQESVAPQMQACFNRMELNEVDLPQTKVLDHSQEVLLQRLYEHIMRCILS